MQKSVVSKMANPSMFPLPNKVQYLHIFVYSPENFFIMPPVGALSDDAG